MRWHWINIIVHSNDSSGDGGSGSRFCRKSFYFSSSHALFPFCFILFVTSFFSLLLFSSLSTFYPEASLYDSILWIHKYVVWCLVLYHVLTITWGTNTILPLLSLTLNSFFHSFILFFRRTLVEYHFMLFPDSCGWGGGGGVEGWIYAGRIGGGNTQQKRAMDYWLKSIDENLQRESEWKEDVQHIVKIVK